MLMRKWFGFIRRNGSALHRNQRGAEAMEYLIVTSMVIIMTVAAWRFLGKSITDAVNKISDAIEETTSSGQFPALF